MTGGGFGGSAILLVSSPAIEHVRQTIERRFADAYGRIPTSMMVHACREFVSSPDPRRGSNHFPVDATPDELDSEDSTPSRVDGAAPDIVNAPITPRGSPSDLRIRRFDSNGRMINGDRNMGPASDRDRIL